MADASLTVRMALDRLALKQGLDGANADVDGFKKKFETSLRDTRGAVKDVAGSITGIGQAFQGSITGAIGGLRDLIQLIPVSPWAAMAAAVVAATTSVIKSYESMYAKLDELGEKAGRARAKGAKEVTQALGLPSDESAMKGASFAELAAQAERGKKAVADYQSQIVSLEGHIGEMEKKVSIADAIWWGDDTAERVKRLKIDLADLYKRQGEEAAKANAAQSEADKRALAAAQNRVEQANKALKVETDAAKERERERERDLKAYDKYVKAFGEREHSLAELDADRAEKEKDIFGKSRSSIFDGGDIYQRMGAQVGMNLSPELRQADLKQQREKELVDLAKRHTAAVEKIEARFSEALNQQEY